MKKMVIAALIVLAVLAAPVFAGGQQETGPKTVLAGVSIRSLSNPYYLSVEEGAKMFADSVDEDTIDVQLLVSDGSDEKELNNIKAAIARGGKDTILYVDPNNAPNAAAIAEICEEAGVYWMTVWSTAEGLHPRDYPHYVFHMSPDDQKSGHDIAVAMFDSFKTPGKGKILAIQGMLANSAAINRFKGLQKALSEYPGVELIDDQAGDWNPAKALEITETWLSTYGDIDGIWVANDSMALAVVEALRAKGLNGKVAVAGVDGIADAITAIQNGDMVATVSVNPWLQGGFGLALPYAAYKGYIDTTKMTEEQMMFNTAGLLVSTENIDDYVAGYIEGRPTFDFEDYWSIIYKAME